MLLAKGSQCVTICKQRGQDYIFTHELYVILTSSNDIRIVFFNTHTEVAIILRKGSITEIMMFQICRKLYSVLSKQLTHFRTPLMALQLSELNPTKHKEVN